MDGKTVLVFGVTGRQGGAVARHLHAKGWNVHGLTRDPSKPNAKKLEATGVELVKGDLNDQESIQRAVKGAYGVFAVLNPREVGHEGEIRQAKGLVDCAKAAGIQHLVYSSGAGTAPNSGVPHIDGKAEIEAYVKASGLPWTIVRPVIFMENFLPSKQLIMAGVLLQAYWPDAKLQYIAVNDIGMLGAYVFENQIRLGGKSFDIAGDEFTMTQAAETFTRVLGKPVRYVQQSLDQIRSADPINARRLERVNNIGFEADIPTLRNWKPDMMTLEQWLRTSGFANL